MSSGMSGRGLSWKCALLLIRTRGWICGQCTPWDNLVWNHVTTHQKEAPAHAQGTNRGSLHESMGKVSSGKLFPWGRSEGTERDRGTLPLPSDSSLILPRNWLRKKRAFSESSVCATGSNPPGGLTSRLTEVSLALGMGNAWELSRQLAHFLPLRRVRFDHANF